MSKRYNFNDHFEMLYLRHEYIAKIPPELLQSKEYSDYIEEFAGIIATTAKIMHKKLKPNFDKVCFDVEDIEAITKMYLLSYMGLYSLRNNVRAMDNYVNVYKSKRGADKYPNEREIAHRERNNMINFLRQRLQHCSTICARKARNITVGRDRRGAFAETETSIKVPGDILLDDHSSYNYRKLTNQELKEIKLKAKEEGITDLKDSKGFPVVVVEILNSGISHEDYKLLLEEQNNTFGGSPEDYAINMEETRSLISAKTKFDGLNRTKKRNLLRRFVNKEKDNRFLKKELILARKMLRSS